MIITINGKILQEPEPTESALEVMCNSITNETAFEILNS